MGLLASSFAISLYGIVASTSPSLGAQPKHEAQTETLVQASGGQSQSLRL
jgi:hypothetical protein